MNIILAIEELCFSGGISLGRRSRSTVYRWTKAINEYLERNDYDWRVTADYEKCCINRAFNRAFQKLHQSGEVDD